MSSVTELKPEKLRYFSNSRFTVNGIFEAFDDDGDYDWEPSFYVPDLIPYGAVTLLAAFWCDVRVLRRIPAGSFWPPPQVTSSAVLLTPHQRSDEDKALYPAFKMWVRTLFRSRRKQLRGLLRGVLGEGAADDALTALSRSATVRPEVLGHEDFLLLARQFPLN